MQKPTKDRQRVLLRAAVGVGTAAGLAVTTLATMSPASAAIPSFPDNVVVFPDRDFVSVEGYQDHKGETATLTITRDGVPMGSAKAEVSGTDVAFEVNHPGGVCWGNNTSLQVTPDIQAGDVATISFADGSHDETTTSSATVTGDMTRTGQTVTVKGKLGPEVDHANVEQRIINPDLVDVVGKRDVRALPGPVVPAPKGGYSSGMDIAADGTFVATYQFDTLEGAVTTAAADLGERAMSWQVVDADGNRQGLTIAEYGEAGGPGMGGCPMGPGDQSAPDGTASVVRPASDKSTAVVNWNPTAAQPGADAVSGYSVEAINSATQTVTGIRVGANATQATLGGLSTDPSVTYTFEVRSMTGTAPAQKLSVPFTMGGAAGTPGDTTQPNLTVSPKGGALNTEQGPDATTAVEASSVTVASNGQVFFTTDGSPAIVGDAPSDKAQLYTGPIPITALTALHIAAFDQAGNSLVAAGSYKPVSVALPAVPTGLAGTQTQSSVALTWNSDTSATGYQVTAYDALGVKLATQPPVTSVAKQTVTGLTPGATYQFSVAAKNAAGASADSAMITKTTDQATDRVTITSAKWKSGDFRIVGTGSVVGKTVQVYRVNADGTRGAAITGATAAVVAAAPPGIGDYDIRLRTNVPTTNPGRILVVSNGGGVAGPFTVTNG